jgi:hypothetical protein
MLWRTPEDVGEHRRSGILRSVSIGCEVITSSNVRLEDIANEFCDDRHVWIWNAKAAAALGESPDLDTHFADRYGFGMEFRIARRLSVRADYEYQFWPEIATFRPHSSHILEPRQVSSGTNPGILRIPFYWTVRVMVPVGVIAPELPVTVIV